MPTRAETDGIVNDSAELRDLRSRLSDISCWKRLVSPKIRIHANRADSQVGKFWQSRFKGMKLLCAASILARAAYVDLKPI